MNWYVSGYAGRLPEILIWLVNASERRRKREGTKGLSGLSGGVNVGMSADTAEFAVQSIRQWW